MRERLSVVARTGSCWVRAQRGDFGAVALIRDARDFIFTSGATGNDMMNVNEDFKKNVAVKTSSWMQKQPVSRSNSLKLFVVTYSF